MTRRYDIVETNGKNLDLLTSGQVLLRLSLSDNKRLSRGDTSVKQVSGAELNVAVGAALLELHTGVVSKLPAHDIGSLMKGKIHSFGVSDDFFMYDQPSAARVGIYCYENGAYPRKPKVIYDRNHSSLFSPDIDKISEKVYTTFKCFHTTGIILALNRNTYEITTEMIKRLKATGTPVFFDINFWGNLWTGDQARECILRILPYMDILFCSGDTARLIFLKTGTTREMMKSFTEEFLISAMASAQRIVHSPERHTLGFVIYDVAKDEYYEEEPYRGIEVVDWIGNGDAYISGTLYELPSISGNCAKAVAFGNATAAVKNAIPGDLPSSSLEEIQTITRAHNQAGPQSEMAR